MSKTYVSYTPAIDVAESLRSWQESERDKAADEFAAAPESRMRGRLGELELRRSRRVSQRTLKERSRVREAMRRHPSRLLARVQKQPLRHRLAFLLRNKTTIRPPL